MHRFRRFIGAALCALLYNSACAEAAPIERERELQTITVNPDGSYIVVTELVILVREHSAVASASQQSFEYNGANSTADVVTAYTVKADGARLAVDAASIKDQQLARSIDAPDILDLRRRSIIFPHVAAGDRLVYTTRVAHNKPLFEGQFSDVTAPGDAQTALAVEYDVPAGMILQSDNRGFLLAEPTAQPGRHRYRWAYAGRPRPRAEAGAVNRLDSFDRLFVTTFADHAALARAYENATHARGAVTPAVSALATSLVANVRSERDKAIALATWVRNNIRPLDVAIGAANTLAPHSADQVLANRYGDSRDEAVLLRALLDAAGIPSTAALINGGNVYVMPTVAAISVLNQAIVYVPSLDLYLAPIDRATSPGFLPPGLLDKPVLLTASATMARTPPSQRDSTEVDTEYAVARDGAADIRSTVVLSGANAEAWRAWNRAANGVDRAAMVENLLRRRGQSGSGDWDLGRVDDAAPYYKMIYSGHSDDLAALPGPIGVRADSALGPGVEAAVASLASESERRQDFVCPSQEIEEKARYRFADGVRIIALPKPVTLHDALFDYASSYRQQDGEILIRRHYRLHHPRRICGAADYSRMQASLALIQRDLRNQLIIQSK